MVEKVHGSVNPGESLTGNLEFFTVTTSVNILTRDAGTAATQAALDKLVEVISLRGQPIIMGAPFADSGSYVFKFAIEHAGAWTGATPSLRDSIAAHASSFGFTTSNTTVAVAERI
jgi:hypothetical protein